MTIADAPYLLQEVRRRHNVPALTLNRFKNDRRNLFWRQNRLEKSSLDVPGTVQRKGLFLFRSAAAPTVGIRITNMGNSGNKRSNTAASAEASNQSATTPPIVRP